MTTTNPFDLAKAVGPIIRRLQRLEPEQRVRIAHQLLESLLEVQAQLAGIRRGAIRELRMTRTLDQVGQLLGLSVTRVKQLSDGPTKPTVSNRKG
jgi:DNA-directed RNA polymerase sigma subunit (sigma70/sigma32)